MSRDVLHVKPDNTKPIGTDSPPDFEIADQIAVDLTNAGTDHNEVAKASAYLNRTRNADDFFTWLEWMAAPRVSADLARSRRTPVYYQQIRGACQQLRQLDDADAMAQTLAWAVRLMRYHPVARPIPPEQSVALHPAPGAASAGSSSAPSTGAQREQQSPADIRSLRPGMELQGTVRRVAPFGAFVDVGVGRDGLVHVSKLRQGYVERVEDVVSQGQTVIVWVESVDAGRGRISLTMIGTPNAQGGATRDEQRRESPPAAPAPVEEAPAEDRPIVQLHPGDAVEPEMLVRGVIQRVEQNRILVDIGLDEPATLAFARLAGQPTDPDEVAEELPAGTEIVAEIVRINRRGRIQLALHDA